MPTLTVAGHSVTVGDDFLKLTPEEQNQTVDEIAKSLPAAAPAKSAEPSGIAAGFSKGISDVAGGDASTLKLTGAPTAPLDAIEANTKPDDYHAAHLIREGGHWYNPADYQPSALPQMLAEQAPGMAQDMAAGWTAGKLMPGSAPVKALAGMGGYAGSALLRTFGPGAHANADARTGVPNSPVETTDLTREASKQAVEAPINMLGGGRLIPGANLPGKALSKYLTTLGVEGATGAAGSVANQVGTTAGSKDGISLDGNQVAEAAAARAAGSAAFAAPRLAADTANNIKYGKIESDPDTKAAATDLANRYTDAADGRKLVGPLGGTAVSKDVRDNVHADVHNELSDAAKTEDNLSQGSANTLSRIQKGGTATPTELQALSEEADPNTVNLARQAMLSANVKATGGLSGAMENIIPKNIAGKTTAAAIGLALGHGTGLTLPVVGAGAGVYGASRALDKLTGARSPVQGFTNRFADPSASTTEPTAPAPPVTTSVPQVAPPQDTALWGSPAPPVPSLAKTLTANARVDDGMAKITKMIGDQKRKATIAQMMPMLQQLAATQKPVTADVPAPAPTVPAPSPIALKMLQAKLKAGLPPAPAPPAPPQEAPANVPAPQPQISPTALAMLKQKLKTGLPPAPVAPPEAQTAPVAAAPVPPPAPVFNPTALSMLKQKLKQGLPNAEPASPQIAQAMQTVAQHNTTQAAPPAAVAPTPQPVVPQPPMIAKISKKLGTVKETPHAPEDQPYQPIPEEGLWRKGLSDSDVADKELAAYSPKAQAKYRGIVMENRANKRDALEDISAEHSPEDAHVAASLYHDLDHVSRRKVAARSIEHHTRLMSPEAAKAVHAHFTPKRMEKMWHSE